MIDMFWLYTPGAEPCDDDRIAVRVASAAITPWAAGHGRPLALADRAWNALCDEADAMFSGALPSEL